MIDICLWESLDVPLFIGTSGQVAVLLLNVMNVLFVKEILSS